MKKLFFCVLLSQALFSQVGINTQNPESTLDIRAKNHLGAVTATDGILIPRVTDLSVNGSVNGQLVYLVASSGTFTQGFYYWNGSAWTTFSGAGAGDSSPDAWVDDSGNVVLASGSVGIGTITPNNDAVLDVNSANKGFLPPRVALISPSLATPLTAHVAGMIVYNTASINGLSPGLYINDGTKWAELSEVSETEGTVLTKIKYRGRNIDTNGYDKPTLKVPSMNMEFRFATTSGSNYLEVRLLTAPTGSVTYYANILWFGTNTNGNVLSVTFTPANWNVWSRSISSGTWNNPWGYQFQISTATGIVPGSNDLLAGNFYGFNNFNNGAGINNEMYVLAFEQY